MFQRVAIFCAVCLVCGCESKYDYAGEYELRSGSNCEKTENKDDKLMTVYAREDAGKKVYMARMNSQFVSSFKGAVAAENNDSFVDDKDSLILQFKKDRNTLAAWESSVDVFLKIKGVDGKTAYLESFALSIHSPLGNSEFDFVKDKTMVTGSKRNPNPLLKYVTEKGICLAKV